MSLKTREAGLPQSYRQILKSSLLIGGASVVNIAIGIVRTKAMAVLLGPSGVGLLGLYASIADLGRSIAGMGINSSGVRQIAEAVGSGDEHRIARTAATLRRTSIVLGLLGAVLLIGLSRQISGVTFGDDRHTAAIALLSIAVFVLVVAEAQGALIQGMRRIGDLAKMTVLGALFGTLISIPVVYVLREEGVVPSLVGTATMTLITSWWYRRKVQIEPPVMTTAEVGREQAALLKLGAAFMASGVMMLGATYAVRILVLRSAGLEAAGLYQCAWTLGGLYVGFILQAMGADFYPRLTAAARDDVEANRVVNEQAQVSLLLAGPGVVATLTGAPVVIAVFYTAEFQGAVAVLRWICLGVTLRVISWPMGYIILAKGKQGMFFASELAWTAVYLGLAWVCVRWVGLDGAGIAFFGSYIVHCGLIYVLVRRLTGFRWVAENWRAGALLLGVVAVVFGGFHVLPAWLAMGSGVLAAIVSGAYALRVLVDLASLDRVPRRIAAMLVWARLAGGRASRDSRGQ